MNTEAPERVQVLIVEDGSDAAALLQAQLAHLGHDATHAPDLTSAVLATEDAAFDLIFLDLGLPDVSEPLHGVRTLVPTRTPIVVITNRNDAELALAALDAGAEQYLIKERLDVDRLHHTIDAVLRSPRRQRPPPLATVDLDADVDDALEMLGLLLPDVCWTIGLGDSAPRGTNAAAIAATLGLDVQGLRRRMVTLGWNAVDLEVSGDLAPPHPDELCAHGADELRSQRCVVLTVGDPVAVGVVVGLSGADIGAIDPTSAELPIRHLERALQREQARIDAQLRADAAASASEADALTGLRNRRGFNRVLLLEEKRTQRAPMLDDTIFVIDLDGLKHVNDTEGHEAGDRLIRLAAETLRRAIRGSDQIFRIGGDEFVILATASTPPGPGALLDRLRSAMDDAGVRASIGSATRAGSGRTLIEAFSDADDAMYLDKRSRKGGERR
ncbi:MAG: diguanylate cyclase [Acidimicrobiales bacterium]|nr:diguanylate cyclase [Acidimicrobiales bacterium]